MYLSNNYTEPEALIDATPATFLISENIPSPMGAYLSAFENLSDAEKIQADTDSQEFINHVGDILVVLLDEKLKEDKKNGKN